MPNAPIQMLARYRVDRADGMAAAGPERLVILALKGNESQEVAFALSRADAMLLSLQLQTAATELQTEHNLGS